MSLLDQPGRVYVVANPNWPLWVKVGRVAGSRESSTARAQSRLTDFNVSDPYKSFRLVGDDYAACCLMAEQFAHQLLEVHHERGKGEWFRCNPKKALEIVRRACEVARQHPGVRGRLFEQVLEQERVTVTSRDDETVKILQEISRLAPSSRAQVGETARAAHAVIKDLLECMATPDERLKAAAEVVLRRLDALGGKA